MKYYLIGMPGSGKSTIGRELAKMNNLEFIDTDQLIEKQYGKISDLFLKGEQYFRDIETDVLRSLMSMDDCVISCGGGIVVRDVNKLYMNGLIIYLDVPLKELVLRLNGDSNDRPLMKTNSVEKLYETRKDKYNSFKDISICNTIISKAVSEITKEGKKYEKKKGSCN